MKTGDSLNLLEFIPDITVKGFIIVSQLAHTINSNRACIRNSFYKYNVYRCLQNSQSKFSTALQSRGKHLCDLESATRFNRIHRSFLF